MSILEPTEHAIQAAAAALLRGELVVVPTETVYGLACVATDVAAVLKVFAAKGRPAENPLIVHLASIDKVQGVAREFPEVAVRLAEAFWPGPLTLVLPKLGVIPDEVTAGLDSVAVRVPLHPVTSRLLRTVGLPLAAPSANRFMSLSPTRAQDVEPEIVAAAAMVLDGGPTDVGIESTVVDCTGEPTILRPGGVSRNQIEEVLGYSVRSGSELRKAPGQYGRHYAPRTPMRLAPKLSQSEGGLTFGRATNLEQIQMPLEPSAYAVRLYQALRQLDERGLREIVVESPPQTAEWEAVNDRLRKACQRLEQDGE